MAGVVVKTVEELKAVQKTRSHPTIFIEGGLANDLIISGTVRSKFDYPALEAEVLKPNAADSLRDPIYRILIELSQTHCFEIVSGDGRKRIRVYPRPSCRREGN
jgi:hypothetical protein